jgi:isoquinoline 1-oxidoreductase beta subunit
MQQFSGDPDTPLLWFVRDVLGLKGTKFGCGVGLCGICTVLIDGEANHACMVSMEQAANRKIVTIEGLVEQNHVLLYAWIEHQVPQCGYCQPGQIMTAAALLNKFSNPGDEQITDAMSSVLCRCGTYQRIRRAITYAIQHKSNGLPDLAQEYPSLNQSQKQSQSEQVVMLDEWIRVAGDDTVTVLINHAEMGQGVVTGLAMLVAEELDVELNQVRTEFAPAASVYRNPLFNEQTTGGSTSIRGEWKRLRMVGAKARWRLVEAAAQSWQVPHSECRTENGTVFHEPSKRRLGYGALAPRAKKISPPESVPLKHPEMFRLLGQSQPRLEIPLMVTARAGYGIDITIADMLAAAVIRRPFPNARVQTMDIEATKRIAGVIDVTTIGNGVAVLAQNTWAAIQGRQRLHLMWQEPDNGVQVNNKRYQTFLSEAIEQQGEVVRQHGNVNRALMDAANVIEATYETSYLAHAALETLNCTAHVSDSRCDVWLGTQSQEGAQAVAAVVCGLPKHDVHIHSTFLGGSFGRRLESDFVTDAVELSRFTHKPVQVLWSRADDMQHDFYRPAHTTVLRAALDNQGRPTAWWQRSAGANMALDMVVMPYDIPNFAEEQVVVESPLRVGAWRSVGAGQNAFVVESFADELAHAAGGDPLEYRLTLLSDAPRSRTVLQYAADKARWGSALPENHYQGIAHYESFGSRVAQVAELSVEKNDIRLQRIVSAIDCGQCVNPDAVSAQIEGAIAMGLSAALKEQVIFENATVIQSNFEQYPILTFDELPEIEVYILPSKELPGGIGEPGLPPVAPAVANAIYAATGKRLRKLPFSLPLIS